MRLVAALLVLLVASPADADEWTPGDSALEASFATLLLVDYLQTRGIVRDGQETNPIIGSHGQYIPPGMYLLSVGCLHALAALAAPQPYRRILQGVSIAVETKSVVVNASFGYGFTF